jgi:hypothetical protein
MWRRCGPTCRAATRATAVRLSQARRRRLLALLRPHHRVKVLEQGPDRGPHGGSRTSEKACTTDRGPVDRGRGGSAGTVSAPHDSWRPRRRTRCGLSYAVLPSAAPFRLPAVSDPLLLRVPAVSAEPLLLRLPAVSADREPPPRACAAEHRIRGAREPQLLRRCAKRTVNCWRSFSSAARECSSSCCILQMRVGYLLRTV